MDKFYELYTHPLFKNYSRKKIKDLSSLFIEYSCDEGGVIYYEKDGADSLYIFIEGEYCSSTSEGDKEKYYLKGDYTNPEHLLNKENHKDTLICRSSGSYLKIHRTDFLSFYNGLRKKERELVNCNGQGNHIPGLDLKIRDIKKDQPVKNSKYQWRRSSFFLFEKLLYPLVFLIIILLFSTSTLSFPHDMTVYKTISFIILLYSLVRLLMWMSEIFNLTESDLSAVKITFKPPGIKKNLLPLDQIRGIKIEKKKLKNRFFNIGSIMIQTSSGTVLQLSDIDKPQKVQEIITDFINRSKKQSDNRERVEIRKKMELYFESKENVRSCEKVAEQEEEDDSVVFKKSLFFLVSVIWWQIIIILGLCILYYYFRDSKGGLFLIPGLPFLFVMLWRFQDWRNDLYKVVNGKIIDINRKPFGQSESNNLADIGFVTNIRSEKKGILQYLFNYGDVLIETAGGSIKFEKVSSPLKVQSRLLLLRERWKMIGEEKKRSQQFQDFLVYSEIYKQEEEQNRIRRLTPPLAEELSNGDKNNE